MFVLQPDVESMAAAPVQFHVHTLVGMLLFADLAVHPAGARLHRAAALPVPSLHRLPQPGRPDSGADRPPASGLGPVGTRDRDTEQRR